MHDMIRWICEASTVEDQLGISLTNPAGSRYQYVFYWPFLVKLGTRKSVKSAAFSPSPTCLPNFTGSIAEIAPPFFSHFLVSVRINNKIIILFIYSWLYRFYKKIMIYVQPILQLCIKLYFKKNVFILSEKIKNYFIKIYLIKKNCIYIIFLL